LTTLAVIATTCLASALATVSTVCKGQAKSSDLLGECLEWTILGEQVGAQ
jgi:hypothetical protein